MTYAAEVAKRDARLVYLLAVEGLGWTLDDNDPDDGFNGTIFCTRRVSDDFEGVVRNGGGVSLRLRAGLIPESVSESLDPRKVKYDPGAFSWQAVDVGNFLLENFAPAKEATETTIYEAFGYSATTIKIAGASPIFDENEVIWVGRREAIALGPRTTSVGYATYTDCVRGYLGTPRGRRDPYNQQRTHAFIWDAGVSASPVNRYWTDRRVRLWAIPENAATSSEAFLIFQGLLKRATADNAGVKWSFSATGDVLPSSCNRMRISAPLLMKDNSFRMKDGVVMSRYYTGQNNNGTVGASDDFIEPSEVDNYERIVELAPLTVDEAEDAGFLSNGWPLIKALYQYRSEPGGTAGMYAGGTLANPLQAADYDGNDAAESLIVANGNILRVKHRHDPTTSPALVRTNVNADGIGQWFTGYFTQDTKVHWCLDNLKDGWNYSRYSIDRMVRRNPIDVALMHMTTMPDEFYIFDAQASSTTTLVRTPVSQTANTYWVGHYLHCVEGVNKGYSRKITGVGVTHANNLQTEAWPNTPGTGDEYQIRNTRYDVLPITWGMGIHKDLIDVEAFEEIREAYFKDVQLGRFIIDGSTPLDFWGFLHQHIFEPYGIAVRLDRTTRKITPVYVGDPQTSGVYESVTALTKDDIFHVGDLNYSLAKPVTRVYLKTRDKETVKTRYEAFQGTPNAQYGVEDVAHPDPAQAKAVKFEIVARELESAMQGTDREALEVSAMLNTIDDIHNLLSNVQSRLLRYAYPAPTINLKVGVDKFPSLYVGCYVSITFADALVNPFTAARGWDGVTGRVIGLRLPINTSPTVEIDVELLEEVRPGLIAPAGYITSRTTGAAGNVTISDTEYTSKLGDKDLYYFTVGDELEIRDDEGALIGNLGTITSFGSNLVSDPTLANSSRINVSGTVPSGGTYVTFAPYSNTQSTSQKRYAALVDGSTLLLPSSAPPKEYV